MRKPRRTRPPARRPGPTDQARSTDRHDDPIVIEREGYWQGPLPPPSVLDGFQKLVPDAPERIFRQWERESEHRRSYEQAALQATIRREARGQISATVFALSALAVSAFALWMHEPWVAGTIGGGTIVSVVGAFLYGRLLGSPPKSVEQPPPRP